MTEASETRRKTIEAVIYNFAIGDAWGYVTEFMTFGEIITTQPLPPEVLKVSDDTQMGLYTMEAIKTIFGLVEDGEVDLDLIGHDPGTTDFVRRIFADHYVKFSFDEDNNRAPGNTVMGALSEYIQSARVTGLEGAESNDSLGCGTIMRTPWIGLLPIRREDMVNFSILQSQTTHGHPGAWISSAVLTLLIDTLSRISEKDSEIDVGNGAVFDLALSIIDEIYSMDLPLLEGTELEAERFREALKNFSEDWGVIEEELSEDSGRYKDLTVTFGEGWIATEALYCGIGATSLYRGDTAKGIRRLVYTNGDSDSIAAIGGAIMGAIDGETVVPKRRLASFEPRYSEELSQLVEWISEF